MGSGAEWVDVSTVARTIHLVVREYRLCLLLLDLAFEFDSCLLLAAVVWCIYSCNVHLASKCAQGGPRSE